VAVLPVLPGRWVWVLAVLPVVRAVPVAPASTLRVRA